MVENDIERCIGFDDVIVTHGDITLVLAWLQRTREVTGRTGRIGVILNASCQGSQPLRQVAVRLENAAPFLRHTSWEPSCMCHVASAAATQKVRGVWR